MKSDSIKAQPCPKCSPQLAQTNSDFPWFILSQLHLFAILLSSAMPWYSNCLCQKSDNSVTGWSEDGLTSLTDKMSSSSERKIDSVSIVRQVASNSLMHSCGQTTYTIYINGENFTETRTVMETKCIGDQGFYAVSNSDQNTVAETKHSGLCSNSNSDQSTIAGETNANTPNEPALFVVRPSYVEQPTDKRLVDLFYKISVRLDDLEIKGCGSHIPDSDEDLVEVLFHYGEEDIWVYVLYGYAMARDDFKWTVLGGLTSSMLIGHVVFTFSCCFFNLFPAINVHNIKTASQSSIKIRHTTTPGNVST